MYIYTHAAKTIKFMRPQYSLWFPRQCLTMTLCPRLIKVSYTSFGRNRVCIGAEARRVRCIFNQPGIMRQASGEKVLTLPLGKIKGTPFGLKKRILIWWRIWFFFPPAFLIFIDWLSIVGMTWAFYQISATGSALIPHVIASCLKEWRSGCLQIAIVKFHDFHTDGNAHIPFLITLAFSYRKFNKDISGNI